MNGIYLSVMHRRFRVSKEVLYTIHETKRNQLGVFSRRILCLQSGNMVIKVTPCIRPECPDLGFQIVTTEDLRALELSDQCNEVTLSRECFSDLVKKLTSRDQNEIDTVFTKNHFAEIAKVVELEKYRSSRFSNLLEGGP